MTKELEQRISDLEQQLANRDRELNAIKIRSAQMDDVLQGLRAVLAVPSGRNREALRKTETRGANGRADRGAP